MLERPVYKQWFELDKARITEVFYRFKINPPSGPSFWPRSEGYRVLLTLKSSGQYLDPTLTKLHGLVESYARRKGINKWTISIRIALKGRRIARMMVVPKELVKSTKECLDFLNMLTMGEAVVSDCEIDMLQYMFYWKPRVEQEKLRKVLELGQKTGKIATLTAGEGLSVRLRRVGNSSWFADMEFKGYLGWEGKVKPKLVLLRDGRLFITYAEKLPVWYPLLNLISLLLFES